MLTIVTEFSVFRVDKKLLESKTRKTFLGSTYNVLHVQAIELLAWLNDEPVTKNLVRSALVPFDVKEPLEDLGVKRGRSFYFRDSTDTSFLCIMKKETLVRHFTLVRDFVAEYPNENTLPLPTLHRGTLTSLFLAYFTHTITARLCDVAYALSLLNPFSSLVPFHFQLRDMGVEGVRLIVGSIDEKERKALLISHTLHTRRNSRIGFHYLESLPDGGEGVAILCAMGEGRRYLASEEGRELLPGYNSWHFINAMRMKETIGARRLFSEGFQTPDEPLGSIDISCVVTWLITYLKRCATQEELPAVCAMLGLRHATLKNENSVVYAPYQIVAPLSLGIWKKRLTKILTARDVDVSLFEALNE